MAWQSFDTLPPESKKILIFDPISERLDIGKRIGDVLYGHGWTIKIEHAVWMEIPEYKPEVGCYYRIPFHDGNFNLAHGIKIPKPCAAWIFMTQDGVVTVGDIEYEVAIKGRHKSITVLVI